MGDDFFEDKPVGAPSEKKTPKKDSDNVKKSQSSKAAGKGSKAKSTVSVASKPAAAEVPMQIDIVWTVALVVVAFVLGFFFRGLFLPDVTAAPIANDSFTSVPAPQGGQTAPPLQEDQLQEGLPQGHPSIGGETTQSGSAPTAPDGFMPEGSKSGGKDGAMNVESDVPATGPLSGDGQSIEVPADKKDGK